MLSVALDHHAEIVRRVKRIALSHVAPGSPDASYIDATCEHLIWMLSDIDKNCWSAAKQDQPRTTTEGF